LKFIFQIHTRTGLIEEGEVTVLLNNLTLPLPFFVVVVTLYKLFIFGF